MPNNQIKFDIGFNVNKTELNQLKASLTELKKSTVGDLVSADKSIANLNRIKATIDTVGDALEKAYNPKLDTINLQTFNTQLAASGRSINDIQQDFAALGSKGQSAFRDLATSVMTTNLQLKESVGFIDKMAETLGNTIKWNIASSAVNRFTGAIQSAYSFAKRLDTSLNDIRIVTEKSSEEMARFAVQANKAAINLGASTTDYTNASLIYYQQGLSDAETAARTETTLKVANITKQSTDEVSEQLTAVWNGYKVSANEAELYIDKVSAVAATTASDLEELSDGMSKVASTANAMGVDIDQLSAQLSTVISVTRQDASSIGTAFKTIYARMGDLAIKGGTDEWGATLGDVSGKLQTMGINVLDQTGNLRDMGQVMEDVAAKWGTWTKAQQQAAAVALAGKRQYNNLIALFENWDMYESALLTSQTSEGTLQKQQDIYMESVEAHLEQLSASAERLYNSLFDSESFKDFLDMITAAVDGFGDLIDAIGGGGNVLLSLGSIASRVFSRQLGSGLATIINNFKGAYNNAKQLNAEMLITQQFGQLDDKYTQQLALLKEQQLRLSKNLTNEEIQQTNEAIEQVRVAQQQVEIIKQEIKEAEDFYNNSRTEGTPPVNINAKNKSKNRITPRDVIANLKGSKNQLINDQKIADQIFKQYDKYFVAIEEGSDDAAESLEKFNAARKGELANVRKLINSNKLSNEQRIELTRQYDNYRTVLKETEGDESKEYERHFAFIKLYQAHTNAIDEVSDKTDKAIKVFEEGSQKLQDAEENLSATEKQVTGIFDSKKIAVISQNIFTVIGAIGQLISAVQIIQNIGSIWDNNDLTTGEKIAQTIQAVVMAGGMLVSFLTAYKSIMPAATAATTTFGAALNAAFPILLAISAAIGVIVGIISIFSEEQKTALELAQEEYEKATQAVEDLTNAYNNAKSAFEELKDSLEEYEDAQNAIEELKTGTEEWRDAIYESNQAILELLDSYPLLAQYISTDKYGALQISAEGREALIEAQSQAVQAAQRGMYAAQIEQLEASNNLILKTQEQKINNLTPQDILNQILQDNRLLGNSGYNVWTDKYNLADSREALEEDLESGNISEAFYQAIFSKNKDSLISILESYGYWSENAQSVAQALIDSADEFDEIKDIITENKEALKNNTESINLLRQQHAASYLKNKEEYQGASTEVQTALNQRIADVAANDNTLYYDISQNTKTREERENYRNPVAQDWGKIMGYTNVVYHDDRTNDQDQKIVTYIDANGDEQEISINAIFDQMNKEQPLINATKDLEKYLETFEKIADINEDLLNLQSGQATSFVESSQAEVEALRRSGATNYLQQLMKATGQSQEEVLTTLGYDSAEAFFDAWNESFANFDNDVQEIENDLYGSVVKAYKNMDLDQLNTTQMRSVADALEKAFENGGDAGLNALQSLLNKYAADPEMQSAIAEIASTTDWSSIEGVDSFILALEDAGYELNLADDDIAKFINTMRGVASISNSVVNEFDELIERIQTIDELTKDISVGDIISDEDYNTLRSYNAEISELFVRTANGYKFIGSSSDQLNSKLKSSLGGLEDIKKEFENFERQSEVLSSWNIRWNENSTDLDPAKRLNSNRAVLSTVLQTAGLSQDAWDEAYSIVTAKNADKDSDEYQNALAEIQSAYAAAAEQLSNYELGLYDSEEAQELWATSVATSVDEINNAYKQGKLTEEVYSKAHLSWMQDEINQLDLSIDGWTEYFNTISEGAQEAAVEILKAAAALDEIDLHKTTDRTIDSITNKIDNLADVAEHLNETDSLANYDAQIAAQEELRKAQEQRLQEQERIIQIRKDALQETINMVKATFPELVNADGTINEDKLNDLYLSGDLGEKQKQTLQEYLEAEQAVYDAEVTDIRDMQSEIQDTLNEIKSLQYEKWDLELEIKLNTSEAQRDYLDLVKFINGVEDDDYSALAQYAKDTMLTYYNPSTSFGTIMSYYNAAMEAQSNYLSSNSAEDKQRWEENMKAAIDAAQTYKDLADSLDDYLLNALQKGANEFSELAGVYSQAQGEIEHTISLIQLMYGEDSYDKLSKYYNVLQQINLESLQGIQQQLTYWESIAERYKGVNDEVYDYAIEQVNSLTNDLLANANTYISDLTEKYTNAINEIFAAFEDGLNRTGDDLDDLLYEWETFKEKDSRYLDSVNAAYGIQQIEDLYEEGLKTLESNAAAQSELNDLRDSELAILKERDKLTQYDLDRAELQYQIAMKRYELEQAQNTASKMKLVRDSNGNLSYTYVSDQEQTDALQKEYDDLMNQLYNLDKNEWQSRIDDILDVWQQFKTELSSATDEEQRNAIIERYIGEDGLLTTLANDVGIAKENITSLYDTFGMEVNLPDFSGFETFLERITSEEYIENLRNSVSTVGDELEEGINDINEIVEGQLGDLLDKSEDELLTGYKDTIKTTIDSIIDATNKEIDLISSIIKETGTQVDTVLGYLEKLKDAMNEVANQEDKIEEETEKDEEIIETKPSTSTSNNSSSSSSSSNLSSGLLPNIANAIQNGTISGNIIKLPNGKPVIVPFDTGGYTGTWESSNGALAVLHQKELVLNQDDTVNMLSAVKILRNLDLSSLTACVEQKMKLLELQVNMNQYQQSLAGAGSGELSQNVQIEATFPSVTNADEIQTAFKSLINQARQRLGKNDRWG